MKPRATLKGKCGGCKYFYSPDRCFVTGYGRPTTIDEKECTDYRPMGAEPADGMCFADFVRQCRDFYDEHLKPIGYCDIDFDDDSTERWAMYRMTLTRINPRTNQKEFVLHLDCEPSADSKGLMLYENFGSHDRIPPEYGDLRLESMPEQAPQFVYGYFSRLGDALNSTLKGCSLDLRKPKELYY